MIDKRYWLLNTPRTYLSLTTSEAAQCITADIKRITDRLNDLIMANNSDYDSQISSISTEINNLPAGGSTSSTTVYSTLPLGDYGNFADARYWVPYPSYWLGLSMAADGLVVTSQNASSEIAASYGITSGYMFRPHIVPDENDEMEIRLKIVPQTVITSPSATGVDCIFGLMRSGYNPTTGSMDLFIIGLSAIYHNSVSWFAFLFAQQSLNNSALQYSADLGTSVITSLEIKLIMNRGNPDLSTGNRLHYYTYEKNVNGAGFTTLTFGGSPPVLADCRTALLPTYRYGAFAYSPRIKNGMSCKFQNFNVVKGIIHNDCNVPL